MPKIKGKTGSKVITTCSICGRQLTRAGLVGHMRFKHGRDWKAPMIPVEKPLNLVEARSDSDLLHKQLPPTPCCQAKFKLVSADTIKVGSIDTGLPGCHAIWRCESCGSLWDDRVEMKLSGDSGKGEKLYMEFYRRVTRQP